MSDAQKLLLLAGTAAAGWLLYLLAPVLTPFLVAALLAYLGDPIADRLQRLKLSRTTAVLIVFSIMLLAGLVLLVILLPLLQQQLITLSARIPQALGWIQVTGLPWIGAKFGIDLSTVDIDAIRNAVMANWRDIGDIAGFVLARLGASGQWLVAWLAYLVVVPVVTFYMLRDWDPLVAAVRSLLPPRHEATVSALARECDGVLGAFMRGQLLVMLALGLIYSIGLRIVGLEFALLIGMLAGFVSFVPYLGAILGLGAAAAVAIFQFHDIQHVLYVAIVFGVGQALEGMLLSPVLVGDRIGLHPVAVIFAVMAGGQLFGFFGVLLALPAAAVVTVLLRFLRQRYVESAFYTP